jgi:hypothetical protein
MLVIIYCIVKCAIRPIFYCMIPIDISPAHTSLFCVAIATECVSNLIHIFSLPVANSKHFMGYMHRHLTI